MAFPLPASEGFTPSSLALRFNRQANPWAPIYDPAFWNDPREDWLEQSFERLVESHGPALHVLMNRHRDILSDEDVKTSRMLDVLRTYLILRPRTMAEITGIPVEDILPLRAAYEETFNHVQWRSTCYAHAVNFPGTDRLPGFRLVPGGLARNRSFLDAPSREEFLRKNIDGVEEDGGIYMGENKPGIKEGAYRIALYVHFKNQSSGKTYGDFHFLRENRDGTVSHKPGFNAAETIEAFPVKIGFAEHGLTYRRAGFFHIPEGGLSMRAP